jgi:16S rRNA (adenine1518-N6/adenine1519-N6)-dimethyltransferase
MTPTQIRETLAGMGRAGANKALGQHFLLDRSAIQAVADGAHVAAGDRVLEIGPGLGALTDLLLSRGAKVVAIERDAAFADYLATRFSDAVAAGLLEIRRADAADPAWASAFGAEDWKLVSNLPYGITSLVFRHALGAPRPPVEMSVLIQREVAERAVARDGDASLLSLLVAFSCTDANVVRRVPPGAFWPPPKVDSSVLRLAPLSFEARAARLGMDLERLMAVARAGFAHPRKKLRSNLLEGLRVGPEAVDATFARIGLAPNVRAEAVAPEAWIALAVALA